MSLILNIETSTKTCSIAIGNKGKLLACKEIRSDHFVHGERLHQLIRDLFDECKLALEELSAIAISAGPGSFTGLRIGVASAKGIAYALKTPLISVLTTDLMMACYNCENVPKNAIIFPMIDARREEVYTAGYNANKSIIFPVKAQIVNDEFLCSLKEYKQVYFIGDGAVKFSEKIKHDNIIIDPCHLMSATGMIELSYKKLIAKKVENLAYFNPYYLKDFIAHKKNN